MSAELIREESRFVFPLDRYLMTAAEGDRVSLSYSLQVERCVEDAGYSYWYPDVPSSTYAIPGDRRYGIWNLTDASIDGYGLPESLIAVKEGMSEAQRQAYAGNTDARQNAEWECIQSVAHLPVIQRGAWPEEGSDRTLYLPVELDGQAYYLAMEDPRAEEAFAEWAACLEENGLRRGEGPEQLGPADIPEELEAQIRVAVIDVTCKQETRFIERLSSLEAQYQAALIDQNQAALDASVQKQAEVLRQADEIIATHG